MIGGRIFGRRVGAHVLTRGTQEVGDDTGACGAMTDKDHTGRNLSRMKRI